MDYLKIAQNLVQKKPPRMDDKIMLVDYMNMFRRNFSVIKHTHIKTGMHIGGLVGSLRSLRHLIETLSPTRVIIAREGEHSRRNREIVNTSYKAQRQYTAVKHTTLFDSKEEEREAVEFQSEHFFDYAQYLPVQYFKVYEQEADDVIAFFARYYSKLGKKVVIVSTDEDYLQLIDSNVSVYNPRQKAVLHNEDVRKKYNVEANGFLLTKVLTKDKSDNLDGIRGVGKKTAAKLINRIDNKGRVKTLDDLFSLCRDNMDDKLCLKVLHHEELVRTNWELMNLIESKISEKVQKELVKSVNEFVPELCSMDFELLSETDEISHYIAPNILQWIESFRYLENIKR